MAFKPTRTELSKLRATFRKLELLAMARDAKELTWKEYFERDRDLRLQISAVAHAVGTRAVGELPLTLRESGWTPSSPRKPVVVLEYSVFEWQGRMEWRGTGIELRKDGSVGENSGDIPLDRFPLFRRHLDGSWAPLLPLQSC